MNILITGGASGLGEAITRRLASDQSNFIYFTYNNSKEKAEALENEFSNIKSIQCNFKDEESVTSLVNEIENIDLDILINNALTDLTKKHFHKMKEEVFLNSFKNNVMPVIKITQKAISIFRKKKRGKIINILTDYLINNPPTGMSEYVANKAYLQSMSKSWATENIKYGITSNSISPSIMITGLTSDTDERILEQMIQEQPLKRFVSPEEVAESAEYLVNCSNQINGINMIINGGRNVI